MLLNTLSVSGMSGYLELEYGWYQGQQGNIRICYDK